MRAIIIGTDREVNDRSLGTCGGTKQPKHNNISVIDGAGVKKYTQYRQKSCGWL